MKIDLKVLWKAPNSPPLYLQLKELVRSAIQAEVYLPGDRLEGEREFMDAGQFSYPTVARALRELAKEKWLIRKIGSGTFVAPEAYRLGHSLHRFAVFYYNTGTPFFARLRTGLDAECAKHGIELDCISTGLSLPEGEHILQEQLETREYDGLIGYPFGSVELNLRLLKLEQQRGIPVVLLGSFGFQLNCDCIEFNSYTGTFQAAQHLLNSGYRKLIFVNSSPCFPYSEIQTTMRNAIREAVAAFPATTADELFYSNGEEFPIHILEQLAARSVEMPIGVIFDSDSIAREAVAYMRQQDVSIPNRLAVVGAGNLAPFCTEQSPRLSSINWPLEQLGSLAVRHLIQRTRNNKGNMRRQIICDTGFIARDTTPPLPT